MNSAKIRLGSIATARSGDKGNHANIGVVARSEQAYEFLKRSLSPEVVAEFFSGLGVRRVERFELPNVQALNFVLYDALAGGASQSLRIDTQGKLLGTAILELELDAPPAGAFTDATSRDEGNATDDTRRRDGEATGFASA